MPTVTAVTNSTQLSTFTIVRDILNTNTTLSAKFKLSDYYEFEPNLKSLRLNTLPYIVINVPSTDTDLLVSKQDTNIKTFTAQILLVVGYNARDKFLSYANAIVRTIENNVATLEASGYTNVMIDMTDTTVGIVEQHQTVEGLFELNLTGHVSR